MQRARKVLLTLPTRASEPPPSEAQVVFDPTPSETFQVTRVEGSQGVYFHVAGEKIEQVRTK